MYYSQEQIEQYKARIHFEGEFNITKETLDQIIYLSQLHIPFEDLDVFDYGKLPSLDPQDLFDKIVTRNRGGYCFEMNGFFCYMLQSMGFQARSCGCRVMFGRTTTDQNFVDHRATIVSLDGELYFCEVGIGGAMPPAAVRIPIEKAFPPKAYVDPTCETAMAVINTEKEWQNYGSDTYAIHPVEPGWYGTYRRVSIDNDLYDDPYNRTERLEVTFSVGAFYPIDFESPNYFISQSGDTLFCQHRLLNLRTADGYRAISDNVYREVVNGVKNEVTLDQKELVTCIKEKFGIEIPAPLKKM